jgi:hypothetical protein
LDYKVCINLHRRVNQEKADIMLAKLDTNRRTDKEGFLAKMDANQAKADADQVQMQEMMKMLHANQTKTDAKLESLLDRIAKT